MTLALLRHPAEETHVGPEIVECVGALITSDASANQDELVQEVAERFFRRSDLGAVAVVQAFRPVGLLTRARLLLKLARGFGHELYARKPVTRIADRKPLIVDASARIGEVIPLALAREPEAVYDEVIVVDAGGRYVGLLPVRDLVLQQSVAFARNEVEHEVAVERARDLERVEHLRGQFLAHATHELRSPVNAIAALAELARQAGEREELSAVKSRLSMLVKCTTGLRSTVNNLLDLSRLEAGKTELAPSRLVLSELLEEVASTTRLLLGERPVEVRLEVERQLELQSDHQKLRQVLVNLASNAAKFTEEGEIVLSAGRTRSGARLAVCDTGCGIAAEDLSRLFVPFGQLEDALSMAHEGTGLGLVISRSLVKLLGGKIEVTSRPGQGSTFAVDLPDLIDQEPTP